MNIIKFLNKFLPSSKISDPLMSYRESGRYWPLAIRNLQLTVFMVKKVLPRRHYQPLEFDATARLTVVIPYRNREHQLKNNVPRLKAYLDEQKIAHQIVIVEQEQGTPFNRGKLLNIGAQLTWDESDYFCFHDIDMVPLSANYQCASQPLRVITKLTTTHRGYEAFSEIYFSGVITVQKQHFQQANGFSNNYWGWGKEDDDFLFRLLLQGLVPYEDIEGEFEDHPNPEDQDSAAVIVNKKGSNRNLRSLLLRGQIDPIVEGLNTLDYQLCSDETNDVYRKIIVKL